jgi:NADH dehydrogenase [ubiquinone] 1 alpha subcomplex assembly factor 5
METPPVIFDRRLIRRWRKRWAKSAPQFLNEVIIADLAARLAIVNRPLPRMVLHGTGAAALENALAGLPKTSQLYASDSIQSPGVALLFDDDALPFAAESLSGYIHMLGLESVNDIPGTLAQIRRSLAPDGLFLAAALGGETLNELRRAWLAAESDVLGGTSPRIAPFVHVREWGTLLQRAGFALPVVDADRRIVRYPDLLALMRDLRGLGLANALLARSRRPLTRRLLRRLTEAYVDHFAAADGRISATFEIIYLTAWSPHESQPKPLRPGSAAKRLADALGVRETKLKRDG